MDELDGRNFIDDFGGRSLKTALARIPTMLFTLPLYNLEQSAKPTDVDHFIKEQFWELVLGRPIKFRKKYRVSELYSDICTYTHFYNNILGNPVKFAWVLRAKFNQSTDFKYTNQRLLRQIEQCIENPIRNKRGELTASYCKNLLRFMEILLKYSNTG